MFVLFPNACANYAHTHIHTHTQNLYDISEKYIRKRQPADMHLTKTYKAIYYGTETMQQLWTSSFLLSHFT